MSKRKLAVGVALAAAAAAAVAGYALTRPADAGPPKGTPGAGSCWAVDEAATRQAFPWPGQPVDCQREHTAEVFHVDRVDAALAERAKAARGDEARLAQNIMYAQARRACTVLANGFLGGDWHAARVQVIAAWVQPATQGHFGCAVAQSADPAGSRLVRRSGSLRDALKRHELATECVDNPNGYAGCQQPHDGEFVGTYTITPANAPFDEHAVRQAAERGCARAALTYLGLPEDARRSDLRAGYVGPLTASDWLGSDQTFACYVLTTDGHKIHTSVKGLGGKDLATVR